MASVGGIDCDFVRGTVPGLKTVGEVWHPPGRDGFGAQDLGDGDGRFAVTAVKASDSDTVEAWIDSLEALAWTVVTVVDDHEVTTASCLVESVGVARREGLRLKSGAGMIDGVYAQVRIGGTVLA